MLIARPYVHGDEQRIAFRPADERECFASGGHSCAESISLAARAGAEVTTAYDDRSGLPVLFFGCTPCEEQPHVGFVWMLASPAMREHARQFARECPQWLDGFHRKTPLLTNCVDARNTLHLSWLKRVGFEITRLIPEWGHERRPFYEFVRLRHV